MIPVCCRGRTIRCVLGALALVSATALADASRWIAPQEDNPGRFDATDTAALLAANPLGASDNIKVVPLYRDAHVASVLVQVRDREPRHYHADSDITVFMLRGTGVLHIGAQAFELRAGDTAVVPRGAVHYFVNRGESPAAALVIYAPPPGEHDRVLVKED